MALSIGNKTTFEQTHVGVLAIKLSLILYQTAVGRHVGEEYQRQTA